MSSRSRFGLFKVAARSPRSGILEHLAAAARRIPHLVVILALLVLFLTLLYSAEYRVAPPDLQR